MKVLTASLIFLLTLVASSPLTFTEDVNSTMSTVMQIKTEQWRQCAQEHHCPMQSLAPKFDIKCQNGDAGGYPCSNVNLLSFLPLKELGCKGDGNDIWGWTDPEDGSEYAIFCCYYGTSFIDVTEPTNPRVVGFLPTNNVRLGSSWRDAKVYRDHVFIVSEERSHGMQVFDLTRLRNAPYREGSVYQFTPDAYYDKVGSVHNIVINEQTGYAYAVGSKTCNSGLHIIDIQNPLDPQFASCYGDDGYVHDAQCVIYEGPDKRYTNQEICFCYNEDTITIVDVTNKQQIELLSRTSYKGYQYTHQGWLLEGSEYLLANDELDELEGTSGANGSKGRHTRTLKWDIRDLKKPELVGSFISSEESIDHNLYILGNTAYLANYCSGLRILDVSDIDTVKEIGYFDVSPDCNTVKFLGSWSSYPFFESGTIVVSSIERGLFVLEFEPKEEIVMDVEE